MPHEKAHLKKKKSICNITVEIIPCLATETPETHFIDEKLLKITRMQTNRKKALYPGIQVVNWHLLQFVQDPD